MRNSPGKVLAGVVALVFLISVRLPPEGLPGVDLCAFHRLTGLPCPGCGLVRAFASISHGQFARAWSYNPFGFAFYGLGLAILTRPMWGRIWPDFEPRLLRSPWFVRAAIGLVK